jgi:branched-chain amino acid transport system substrate-binding protein
MKKALLTVTLLLLGAFVLNGCGKEKVEEGEKEPYKIGAVFAVTGPASWLGEPEKKTALMLVDQINAKGGIDGHKIDLIVEDTMGSPDETVKAVLKLIEKDNVLAVIGPSRSGSSMAIVDTINEKEVPNVSCAAAEAIVVPVEERKWVFKVPQTDADCARRIYMCMNDLGLKKAGLITGTTGFGKAGEEQLRKLAGEYGIEIVASETYAPGATDMTAELSKIKTAGAEAVINWSIVPAQALVAKQMEQVGLDVQLFQSHGYGNVKYAQEGGEAANGTIFPCGALLIADLLPDDHPRKNILMEYKTDYESKYDESVSTFGGHAYDSLMIVVKALENVGPDRAKIRDYLETINGGNAFVGTAGTFNMTKNDHCGLDVTAFELLTVEDGKFVPYEE